MSKLLSPVRIFVSHSNVDNDFGARLVHDLRHTFGSRDAVWYDSQGGLIGGENWWSKIVHEISNSNIFLVILSADAMNSKWVEVEIAIAWQQKLSHHRSNKIIIPLLYRPCEVRDDLKTLQMISFEAPRPYQDAFAQLLLALQTPITSSSQPLTPSQQALATTLSTREALLMWTVPFQRNPFFTGRDTLLAQLHENLTHHSNLTLTQPQAINGLGGIGKTQIAVEYAYRYRERYRYVLWLRAATPYDLLTDFANIVQSLNLPIKNESDQHRIAAEVKRWLEQHGEWLLIFDNADDLAMVTDFLPQNDLGHILLTTRAQATGRFANTLEVEKMDLQEGIQLLLRRAKRLEPDAVHDQATNAEAIVRAVDGLPLAIDQAGAYIEETQCSLAAYLRFYQTHRKDLLCRKSSMPSDHPEPVASTWALSFQTIEKVHPAAADLLRLCAFLDPDVIPEELLINGASELGPVLSPVAANEYLLNGAIEELLKYSLVKRNSDEQLLSMHRLVQAVLQDEMDQENRKLWAERAVRALKRALLWAEHQPRMQRDRLVDRLVPQALHCAELIETHHLTFFEARSLLNQTAQYLREYARYEEAEPLYQLALHICEQKLGKKTLIPLSSGKLDAAQRLRRPQKQDAEAEKETIWKKLINLPEDIVKEALDGMSVAHEDVISVIREQHVIVRKDAPVQGKVALISGGGSGHEPLHSGFVGVGMLDAACIGPMFTSPTEYQVLAATHAVNSGAGVLYIVKNYLGDKSNFLSAIVELVEEEGIEIAVVFTNDDVGVPGELPRNRRGTGVNVLLEKIVGGCAQTGASLHQVAALAEKVNTNGRSIGMALTPCTLPATGKPLFKLGEDEMTIGIGIHGQCGHSTIKWETADKITERLLSPLIQDLSLRAGEQVLALVSGMGGTPLLELYVVFNAVKRILDGKNITVTRQLVGNYITSLEMAGCSLTLMRLDDELIRYWDAPVRTPALRWGC